MLINGGLILEGGGMRGVYTAGVLDALMDADIKFTSVYGVSAGAGHGCSYLSWQRGRAIKTVSYRDDWRYASFRSLLLTGDFFGAKFVYDDIPKLHVPYDYDEFLRSRSESDFYAVVTNMETGKPEYILLEDLRRDMDAVRASSSLPFLSKIVYLNGTPYLDGGITDSIPLEKSMHDGNSFNLVVLTRDLGYTKQPSSIARYAKLAYRRYPQFVRALADRSQMYNQQLQFIRQEEQAGRALVIRPKKPVEIGRLEKDMQKLHALYEEGLADGREVVAQLPGVAKA